MRYTLRQLAPGLRDDFYRLHSRENDHDWCCCVAWHVASFAGWGERSGADNRALRDGLIATGRADGFLLYRDAEPVAWCQCAPLAELPHLAARYGAGLEPDCWALGCLFVAPSWRSRGTARVLLSALLGELRRRGVPRLAAFPKPGRELPPGEAWTGPAPLYAEFGFRRLGAVNGVEPHMLDLA